MPGFLSAAALHSRPPLVGGDNVPDGPEALTGWTVNNVTKSVNSGTNPPTVTLTEALTSAHHGVSNIGIDGTFGPVARFKLYLPAGTRRYIAYAPSLGGNGAHFIIDTGTSPWTIAAQNPVGVTINSATLTDLLNGDWLFDTTITFPAANVDYSSLGGAPDTLTGYQPVYLGNGSTIIFRRLDLTTVAPPSPVLGLGTPTKAATTGTDLTGATQHTPAGTACIIRYSCRTTTTQTFNVPTATFQGQPVVFPANSQSHSSSSANRQMVGVGYVTGLTPGVPGSLVVTCNRVMGQLVARIDDVANLAAGNIGAAFANNYTTPSKASHSVGVAMAAANSIVLAIVGVTSGSVEPFTVSGWTKQSEDVTGTAAATDVAAVFGTKIGGPATTTETMNAVGNATTSGNWGGAILELKV